MSAAAASPTSFVVPDAPLDREAPCGPGEGVSTTDPVHIATIAPAGSVPSVPDPEQRRAAAGAPAAMEAFVAYCNHLGGLEGRELALTVLTATSVEEQVAAVMRACEESLAMVGSAIRLDTTAAQAAVDCGIPDVPAEAVNPLHSDATNVVAPLPNPVGTFPVGAARAAALVHPEAVRHAAILFSEGPDEVNALRQVEAYESVGWHFSYAARLDAAGSDGDVHAIALAERGVRALVLRAESRLIAAEMERLVADGPPLDLVYASEDGYAQEVAASSAAEGLQMEVEVAPLEGPEPVPEMERYRVWLDAVHPGAVPDAAGVRAWSAGLLFATAAVASDLSRFGLLDALHLVGAWDGHGLQAPADPGTNTPTDCHVSLRIEDGKFARQEPGSGFACDPGGRIPLIGDYGEGAKPGSRAG